MKKSIILFLVAASIAGGAYWFFSPEQQLKRKSTRILESFTLDGTEGNISSSSGALFADSLFADSVKVESGEIGLFGKYLGFRASRTVQKDTITRAIQGLPRHLETISHQHGDFTYKKIDDNNHQISFDHTLAIKFKKPIARSTDAKFFTTFTFLNTEDGLRLKAVTLEKP